MSRCAPCCCRSDTRPSASARRRLRRCPQAKSWIVLKIEVAAILAPSEDRAAIGGRCRHGKTGRRSAANRKGRAVGWCFRSWRSWKKSWRLNAPCGPRYAHSRALRGATPSSQILCATLRARASSSSVSTHLGYRSLCRRVCSTSARNPLEVFWMGSVSSAIISAGIVSSWRGGQGASRSAVSPCVSLDWMGRQSPHRRVERNRLGS